MTIKTRRWTPELRKKQAQRCRKQKPWKHNTGPKTAAGKAVTSRNALKHGLRSAEFREICALLRAHAALTEVIVARAFENRAVHPEHEKNAPS